ncbi:MAG: hypothetical protein ACOVT5_02855, partial [Armatimonadaceae bacterium]
MIRGRHGQAPADKGIRPELLRELALPWRANAAPVGPEALALWNCPSAGGHWTLTQDASLIWRRAGDPSTARFELSLTSSTDRVVRRLLAGKPWRTTTTAIGPVGLRTVYRSPGIPLEIVRELLPLSLLPEQAVPPGMPPLVVRIVVRSRFAKPVDMELTVRTAAPSTGFHRTVGVAAVSI